MKIDGFGVENLRFNAQTLRVFACLTLRVGSLSSCNESASELSFRIRHPSTLGPQRFQIKKDASSESSTFKFKLPVQVLKHGFFSS